MATSKKTKSCLSKEFEKLEKKKSMPRKQKVAIALNVCKVPKKGIGSTGDKYKGKYIAYYYEGVSQPDYFKIHSSRLADPKYAIRDLFLELNSGSQITVKQDQIEDFSKGKQVDIKTSKGYYAIKLSKDRK
jgi:hypothetical protein